MCRKLSFWPLLLAIAFFYPSLFLPAQTLPAPFRNGQLWGYANPETGQIIVPPTLDSVAHFQINGANYPIAWVKKGGRYGLINRAGELVLPIQEPVQLPIMMVAKGFFAVERYALGANSPEEEEAKLSETSPEFIPRPVAFFDKNGRRVGKPFAFQTNSYLGEGGRWEDPNGFDTDVDTNYWPGSPLREIWKDGKVGLFDLKKGQVAIMPVWNSIMVHGRLAIGRRWTGETPEEHIDRRTALIDITTGKIYALPDSVEVSYEHGTGDLILAKNSATGLWGFLSKTGQTAIPFQYQVAHPFSKNGSTKVVTSDAKWSVIDVAGREIIQLGKFEGYQQWPDGSIWLQSDYDRLYRKKDAAKNDTLGLLGFDYPPGKVKYGTRLYWQGQRFRKTGVLDSVGRAVLPFEFDYLNVVYSTYTLPQDSSLHKQLLTLRKNGRSWVFDSRNLKPIWPKLQPGNGLTLGETFDKSNFELVQVLAGDSLYAIQLADGSQDILNIRTGRRWGVTNARGFSISPAAEGHGPLIYYNKINGDFPERRYGLNGQVVLRTTGVYGETLPGLGNCTAGFNPETGLTIVFDATGRSIGQFRSPFAEAGSRILIDKNEGGQLFPYVFSVTSETGKSAVFSPDGRLISPPDAQEAQVYHDLMQVSCDPVQVTRMSILMTLYQYKGLYRLTDGQEVLPCQYSWISVADGEIRAYTPDRLLYRLDIRGKMLGLYPPDYSTNGAFSNGLQAVRGERDANYVNEKLQLLFPAGHLSQARSFSEGLGAVKMAAGWRYIHPTGKLASEEFFVYAESFVNGRAIVRTKDGWTRVIDPLGTTVFEVPSSPNPEEMLLTRLGRHFIMRTDTSGKYVLSLDGQLLLKNFDYYPETQLQQQSDTVHFYSNEKLGYLLPTGQIKWATLTDFVPENDRENGYRYVLKGFGCPVEGLLKAGTKEWIVKPKIGQTIFAPDYQAPIAFVWDKGSQNRTVVNRNTGAVMPVEPGHLQSIEGGLGWLLLNTETETSWLYSPDFQTKKRWNYRHQSIYWQDDLGLYRVNDLEYNTVGYISKNGHVLFEN